jgi:hypothetical protein
MPKIILLVLCSLVISLSKAQDFRSSKWGDTPDIVKKNEKLPLLQGNYVKNKLESLSYVEFTDSAFYYTYYYVFYDNKLVGGRTKTAYLTLENSRYNILQLYNQVRVDYEGKYKTVKEEKVATDQFKKFSVALKDRRIFVEIKQESGDYYLLESVIHNRKKK